MPLAARKLLITLLVGAFCLQTWRVYADPAGRQQPPLSPAAIRGRALWHGHNCQSCHQLFGFGGFLGPDLTNAGPRLTEARLEQVLTQGSLQMPAFSLTAAERADLSSFLAEVSARGTGQLHRAHWQPPEELLAAVTAAGAPAAGRALALARNCVGCHLPNLISTHRAPDLTTAMSRLGPDGVRAVLANGVPGTAMPRFGFSEAEQQALIDFLTWMDRDGETVRGVFEATQRDAESWSVFALPWWEFSRQSGDIEGESGGSDDAH